MEARPIFKGKSPGDEVRISLQNVDKCLHKKQKLKKAQRATRLAGMVESLS